MLHPVQIPKLCGTQTNDLTYHSNHTGVLLLLFSFFFHEQKRQSRLYIVTLPLNKMRKPSNTNSSNYPRAAAVYLWLNIHRHVTLLPLRPPKRASKGAQWPIKWGLAGRHSPPIADHTLHCPNWHATLNLIGIFYLLSRSQVFLCYLLPD